MPFRHFAIGLASALFALAAGATAASAATAYASSTVNVRSGPGTGYAVVGVLRPGRLALGCPEVGLDTPPVSAIGIAISL